MLHYETLESDTLELLKALQAQVELKDFQLVGGTALALYWGHRKSIDIDLFSNRPFEVSTIRDMLIQKFGFQISFTAENTLKGFIGNVKTDLITHAYPNINLNTHEDGITLASEPDILAMKLNAISVIGQRSKDFVDLFFALEKYDMGQILRFYAEKYRQTNLTHVTKSLIYFDDVDISDWPVLLKNPTLSWKEVQSKILSSVRSGFSA